MTTRHTIPVVTARGAHLRGALAVAAAGLLWMLPTAAHAAGTATTCDGPGVQVIANDPRDAADACDGARAALAFLAGHGLQLTSPVVLEVAAKVPSVAGPTAVGCYLEPSRRIVMLTYREFARRKTWFKLPIDRALYRSLAAHETAHAVAACNFAPTRPTIQAKEYVAYITMFSTMGPALRTRALRSMPGTGFENEDRITAVFYMFDPMRFGAEAYRHFMKPENGSAFLQSVLAGRALTD